MSTMWDVTEIAALIPCRPDNLGAAHAKGSAGFEPRSAAGTRHKNPLSSEVHVTKHVVSSLISFAVIRHNGIYIFFIQEDGDIFFYYTEPAVAVSLDGLVNSRGA